MLRIYVLLASALCALTAHALEVKGFEPNERLLYKTAGDVKLHLHVFTPDGHTAHDQRPAIVFFFGGGWNGGSPSQFYPHCQHLASRGIVAMSAEYRVAGQHQTAPKDCVADGKSAVRWIRQQAARLGIDPARIAAGGGSAGGQVAAATGTATGFDDDEGGAGISSRPNALVLFNPVFDNGPGGYGHKRVNAYWREFSPMHNIDASTPPTVVFLGTEDRLVPVETAQDYKRRMEAHGRRCDLYLYEGQGHAFFNYTNRDNYTKTVEDMERFLVSLGFLPPAEPDKPAPPVP